MNARSDALLPIETPASPTVGEDVSIVTDDGYPVAGTLLEGDGIGPLVLISAATAVPRGFYAKFAAALVAAGARAALTYDYRGMPGSPPPKGWTKRINMKDWALQDLPAALRRLGDVAPGHPMVGVGQSFGGQALGLCGDADRFSRYMFVASLNGYYGNMKHPLQVFLAMQALGLPIATLLGKTHRKMGLGEPIPASVFQDWARWCRTPDYFFSDPSVPETSRFADVRTPILSIRHSDDDWGTEAAIESLLGHYVNAPIERRVLGPDHTGGAPVGHLGFFRSRFRETLWPEAIEWLLGGSGPK